LRAGPQAPDQLVDHALALAPDQRPDPLGLVLQQQQHVVEHGQHHRPENPLELAVHDPVEDRRGSDRRHRALGRLLSPLPPPHPFRGAPLGKPIQMPA
jgi:hypothetical protein